VQVGVLPFFVGGTVVPMRRFSAEGMLRLIEQERINWMFVAPTMLERVLALPEAVRRR
jgi:long-chain acyl-CoA synthetase